MQGAACGRGSNNMQAPPPPPTAFTAVTCCLQSQVPHCMCEHNCHGIAPVHDSTAQHSAVQYSTVRYSEVQVSLSPHLAHCVVLGVVSRLFYVPVHVVIVSAGGGHRVVPQRPQALCHQVIRAALVAPAPNAVHAHNLPEAPALLLWHGRQAPSATGTISTNLPGVHLAPVACFVHHVLHPYETRLQGDPQQRFHASTLQVLPVMPAHCRQHLGTDIPSGQICMRARAVTNPGCLCHCVCKLLRKQAFMYCLCCHTQCRKVIYAPVH